MLFDGSDFLFYDGAMGTMLQARGLKSGTRPDVMNIISPQTVEDVHSLYVEAGSDIICTNTFGANALVLKEAGYSPEEVIPAAVSAAKRAAGDRAKVALDIGPVGYLLEPMGDLAQNKAYELFKQQAILGEKSGVDAVAIETMSDLNEMEAAIRAVTENTALPVLATMTFGKNGLTYIGVSPEDFAVMAERLGAAAVGLNCSLAPSEMYETAERIAKSTSLPLIIKPNAGLPDSKTGLYDIGPVEFAQQMIAFAKIGSNKKIIGGCCGTTPEYIRELKKAFSKL
jgi:5-methyltetrahydrofolate--homocysteine methyltransferase